MRALLPFCAFLTLAGCGGDSPKVSSSQPPTSPAKETPAKKTPAKIAQFYAVDKKLPKGVKGKLCYGVENASKLQLSPAVEDVWPSASRCFEVTPGASTRYTLTAMGDDGSTDSRTVDVTVGAPPPRIYDLAVTADLINSGDPVKVCFKVENATSIKASPGRFNPMMNCILDKPAKTTTYKISALGEDRQIDTGTVTVKVR